MAAAVGHPFDEEGKFKRFNTKKDPYNTNFYGLLQEHTLGWNEQKRHSDFFGPNANYDQRTKMMNQAIRAAGFDHIHDRENGHIVVFHSRHIKEFFGKSELADAGIEAYHILLEAFDLSKGQNGDWEREGYRLMHEKGDHVDEHLVVAKHPEHGYVGELRYTTSPFMSAIRVEIEPEHQRKGLATAMYRAAEKKHGGSFEPANIQSEDGVSLWSQPNRPFGKS